MTRYPANATDALTRPTLACRLRTKIRTPYHNLLARVSRLEKLQQASELLRRTSRFVILTRRLELQLSEMDKAEEASGVNTPSKNASGTNTPRKSTDSLATLGVEDDPEKERTIAKAALSIAELSKHLFGPPLKMICKLRTSTSVIARTSLRYCRPGWRGRAAPPRRGR